MELDTEVQNIIDENFVDSIDTEHKYTDALSHGIISMEKLLDVFNEIVDASPILFGSQGLQIVLEQIEKMRDVLGALRESDLDYLIRTENFSDLEIVLDRLANSINKINY